MVIFVFFVVSLFCVICDPKHRQGPRAIDTGDSDALRAGPLAADDRDVALGEVQGFGKDGDELGVGGAVDRRCGEPHQQGAVAQAGDAALARAGDDADVEQRAVSRSGCRPWA
ncbi:MAG: hypothetical protein A3J29_14290 [Acidobacteria bacterium RIFCSPLOWO2_12_FULL_67_14b]|nr:MAG: hypothetical protein A3J29_14290 [Acidobacteria bacterium RIFCSPLOWO2_12_FULL_67_14b]